VVSEKLAVAKQVMTRLGFRYGKAAEAGDQERMNNIESNINRYFLRISSIIKHDGFAEEKEKRLIAGLSPPDAHLINFQNAGHFPVSYVEYELRPEDVRAVMVGPSEKQDLASSALRLFLDNNQLSHVEVLQSRIPFRR